MSTKYQTFSIQENGAEYKTTFTKKWANRKNWEKPDPCKLLSHIPGTIVSLKVKEGDKVKAGDVLLILQAMKMDNKLCAPFDSTIKHIYVEEGNKIPKSEIMIELERI